jgi:hypothetical protein
MASVRIGLGATLVSALLAVLERPWTWLLCLVGFLVRGGWLLVLAPIVVLPTAVGVGNVAAPLLEDIAFGRRTDEVLIVIGGSLVAAVAWLVGGGLLAAATEVEAVRATAQVVGPDRLGRAPGGHPIRDVLAVRLSALIPLVLAMAWAGVRFVGVAYRELTVPSDVATPAAYRVLAGAPDGVLALVVTWLFAETVGSMAARSVVLAGEPVRMALRSAIRRLRHAPLRPIVLAALPTLVLLIVLAVTALGTGTGWDQLRAALADRDASVGTSLLIVLFVALFAGGLILLALTTAWRSAVWTIDGIGTLGESVAGTFGGGTSSRSGD